MKTVLNTLSEAQFEELVREDGWIDNISNPVPCCYSNGVLKHYRTCSYPVEYIVTESQIERARTLAEKRGKELLGGIGRGVLAFWAMGGDYPDANGGVGNYRIRCFFRNDAGTKFFIELLSVKEGEGFIVDTADNCVQEEEYNRTCEELNRWNSEHLNRSLHKPLPPQYYHCPTTNRRIGKRFSWENVVRFVNGEFGCSFTSGMLIKHFLSYEDWICEC